MSWIYTLVYLFALGTIAPISFFIPKLKQGFWRRVNLLKRIKVKNPIWFHVASSGELEQAIPLMDLIKETQPQEKILLTYFSPTCEKAVELEKKRRGEKHVPWDQADFSPFDLPWVIEPLLDLINPKMYFSIHREIWPNLLRICQEREIPTALICAFFPEPIRKNYWVYRPWIQHFNQIAVVDLSTRLFLVSKNINIPIEEMGDSRVIRVLQRKELKKTAPAWADFFKSENTLLCASIWKEDFINLKLSLVTAHENKKRLIIVPHEPKDSFHHQIIQWGKEKGIIFRLWSNWILSPDEHSHLIIDSVGLLAELYQICEFVFVGGSFKGRIHNVLEPAAYGKPILTGPYYWNSAQALDWAKDSIGLKTANDDEELAILFKNWILSAEQVKKGSQYLKEKMIEKSKQPLEYFKSKYLLRPNT